MGSMSCPISMLSTFTFRATPGLFSSGKTETLYTFNNNSPFLLPHFLATAFYFLQCVWPLWPLHFSGTIQCLSSLVSLILPCIMSTRCNHVVACILFYSFWMLNTPCYWYLPHRLNHALVNRHSGCFHVLVTMNNGAMNTSVHMSLPKCDFNSSGFIVRGRIAGSYVSKIFYILWWRKCSHTEIWGSRFGYLWFSLNFV